MCSSQPRAVLTGSKEQNALLDDACLLSSADEQYLVVGHVRDSRPLSFMQFEGEKVRRCHSEWRELMDYRWEECFPSIDQLLAANTAASAPLLP